MEETGDLIIDEKEADNILEQLIEMRTRLDNLISIFMPEEDDD